MKLNSLIKPGLALLALVCSPFSLADREGWTSDFAAAKREAVATHRDLLLDFTGSDWCTYCIALDREVFSQAVFKTGVKDKFVLVELDFPNDKSKLSAETIQQNDELGRAYRIPGPPSIVLCDAAGRPFGITGYNHLGPEDYLIHLDQLRARKLARDQSFESATKATGMAKAKALFAGLAATGLGDDLISEFYGDVIDQIKAADPNDETGVAKAEAVRNRINALQAELEGLTKKEDFDGAVALLDKTIKGREFGPEMTQQIMVVRATVLARQRKFDEALKALDEAKAFAPGSRMAAGIDEVKAQIETARKEAGK